MTWNGLVMEREDVAKIEGEIIIQNDRGLHTRPSTELVKCASKFKASIYLYFSGNMANAKSLLGILTLAAARGSRIKVEATGEDAQAAVDGLIALANQNFHIDY